MKCIPIYFWMTLCSAIFIFTPQRTSAAPATVDTEQIDLLLEEDLPPGGAEMAGLTVRIRPLTLNPGGWTRIHWRWGGEGLGGMPVRGEITAVRPPPPKFKPSEVKLGADPDGTGLDDFALEDKDPEEQAVIVVEDKTYNYHYLRAQAWSPVKPVSDFLTRGGARFITFTPEGYKRTSIRAWDLEFEFHFKGKMIKRFVERSPDGPVITIYIPNQKLSDGKPSDGFIRDLGGLVDYGQRRLDFLKNLPWADKPVPRLFAAPAHFGGYAFPLEEPVRTMFGKRTCSKDVVRVELQCLRQLGYNGFCYGQGPRAVLKESGLEAAFSVADSTHMLGYPVAALSQFWKDERGFIVREPEPGAGCPHYPPMLTNLPARVQENLDKTFEHYRSRPVREIWGWTGDEIGSVFDATPEGKAHQGCCPYCRKAFVEYVRGFGLTLEDFGAQSWDDIRSTYGYWAETWEAELARQKAGREAMLKEAASKATSSLTKINAAELDDFKMPADEAVSEEATDPAKAQGSRDMPLSDRGKSLLYYYSRRFNNEASAKLFTPLKEASRRENEKKRQALAKGEKDTEIAQRPWVYHGALRGNSFLMGGHSLDFFDWYRHADTAFSYETSNRDPRIWSWDSYLCDVGRIVKEKGLVDRFNIVVKPHRGACVQRTLSAASRRATAFDWYCYGPDWAKGDSFSGSQRHLSITSKAARMLSINEEVIYDAVWSVPAEVAVVRPLTSAYFENSASWENGKWVYTALTHAHIPVDALDEGFLMSEDLSRYKAIYISGSHIRRDVAQKLADWVKAGGTLFTSCFGLARDEANQPLDILQPVLGLQQRQEPELWSGVSRYGATGLASFKPGKTPPENADTVIGKNPLNGSFKIAVGREVLDPNAGTEILATYGDGKAAATRHAHGKGWAYVVGFYGGLEYSADVLGKEYDMSKDFNSDKRRFVSAAAFESGVRPVVDADQPIVEGVLLKNRDTGKQAVTLMNWAYKNGKEHVSFENVRISIHGAGKVSSVKSGWLDQDLKVETTGDTVTITLPVLEEGDVLLLN